MLHPSESTAAQPQSFTEGNDILLRASFGRYLERAGRALRIHDIEKPEWVTVTDAQKVISSFRPTENIEVSAHWKAVRRLQSDPELMARITDFHKSFKIFFDDYSRATRARISKAGADRIAQSSAELYTKLVPCLRAEAKEGLDSIKLCLQALREDLQSFDSHKLLEPERQRRNSVQLYNNPIVRKLSVALMTAQALEICTVALKFATGREIPAVTSYTTVGTGFVIVAGAILISFFARKKAILPYFDTKLGSSVTAAGSFLGVLLQDADKTQ